MINLMSAHCMRITGNRTFLFSAVFMLLTGLSFPVFAWMERSEYEAKIEDSFFTSAVFLVILSAIFCSLYIGSEYSDGTVRNRITSGHDRTLVYLSDLVACFLACTVMWGIFTAAYLAAGIPLLGGFSSDPISVLKSAGILILLVLALTSIFTMLTELSQNKSACAVLTLLLSVIMLTAAVYIYQKLSAPAFFDNYVLTENGVPVSAEKTSNPEYLQGSERAIYEFLYDFLPGGQAHQLASSGIGRPLRLVSCSAGISLISTVSGIFLFRRRNIR